MSTQHQATPSNTDDIIDSRAVIARIEELEGQRDQEIEEATQAVENAPEGEKNDAAYRELLRIQEKWAQDDSNERRLVNEVQQAKEELDFAKPGPDSRKAKRKANILQLELDKAQQALSNIYDEDAHELKILHALAEEGEVYADDWRHGVTLIRDSHFEDYAQEFAEDIGAINKDANWPNNCIDWGKAAQELKQGYTSIDFDGTEYWVR